MPNDAPSRPTSLLVRRLRRSLGLTQAAFAARLGIGQSIVSRWETGMELPSQSHIIRFVEALRNADDPRDRLTKLSVEHSGDLRELRSEDGFVLACSAALADRFGLLPEQCRWQYLGDTAGEGPLSDAGAAEAAIAEAGFFQGAIALAEYGTTVRDFMGRPRFRARRRLLPVQLTTLEIVAMVEYEETDRDAPAAPLRLVPAEAIDRAAVAC